MEFTKHVHSSAIVPQCRLVKNNQIPTVRGSKWSHLATVAKRATKPFAKSEELRQKGFLIYEHSQPTPYHTISRGSTWSPWKGKPGPESDHACRILTSKRRNRMSMLAWIEVIRLCSCDFFPILKSAIEVRVCVIAIHRVCVYGAKVGKVNDKTAWP